MNFGYLLCSMLSQKRNKVWKYFIMNIVTKWIVLFCLIHFFFHFNSPISSFYGSHRGCPASYTTWSDSYKIFKWDEIKVSWDFTIMQMPLWVFCLSSPLGVSHCVPIGRCRVLISIISWHCMDYLPVPAFICHNAVTQPGFQAALQWLFSALCGTPLPGLPNTLDCLTLSLHSPNGRQIACR